MADFSALIAQIEAYVKQNGNNEITGNGLQSILVGMVNALGTVAITALQGDLADEVTARTNADGAINAKIPAEASNSNKLADKAFVTGLTTALQNAVSAINANIENGYVYAGIATPSGTPVSGKVFYLARQAGTYTNFGGLTLTEGVNVLKYNGTAWSQEQLISIADIYKNPLMGYYECDTAGGTAAKTVAATGYVLPATGGSVKIKMANRNTVANATLNINSTGSKPLYYNGQRAGVGNTWDTNEIVEVFYDGTNYQAYNVAGSNGDGVFDISAYNLTDGQPTPYVDLEAALGTDGANVPQSLRKGGMSVKFIQGSVPSSDNNYVQYWYFGTEVTGSPNPFLNTENWLRTDKIPTTNAVRKSLIPIRGKVSIIGDSISTYAGTMPSGYAPFYPISDVTSVYDMWWNLILSLSGSALDVNASWSGSRVTNGRAGDGVPDFYDRTSILGTPDYIFVGLGTNDSNSAIALGDYDYESSISDLSESEFIPAYIKGVKSLLANYPNAKIVLLIFKMGGAYANAIKNIGEYYNLQVIEATSYYTNNVHPSKVGMTLVAQDIVSFFVKGKVDKKPVAGSENLINSDAVFTSIPNPYTVDIETGFDTWEQGQINGAGQNENPPAATRIRTTYSYLALAGSYIKINNGNFKFIVVKYKITDGTVIGNSGWITSGTYAIQADCLVRIILAYSDNSNISPSDYDSDIFTLKLYNDIKGTAVFGSFTNVYVDAAGKDVENETRITSGMLKCYKNDKIFLRNPIYQYTLYFYDPDGNYIGTIPVTTTYRNYVVNVEYDGFVRVCVLSSSAIAPSSFDNKWVTACLSNYINDIYSAPTWANGSFDNRGEVVSATNRAVSQFMLATKGNTVTPLTNFKCNVFLYSETKQFISAGGWVGSNVDYTVPQDGYIRILIGKNDNTDIVPSSIGANNIRCLVTTKPKRYVDHAVEDAIKDSVDKTLSIAGKSADAKITGLNLTGLKSSLNRVANIETSLSDWEQGQINGAGQNENAETRIRNQYSHIALAGSYVILNDSSYKIIVNRFDKDTGIYIGSSGWVTGGTYVIPEDCLVRIVYAHADNSNIAPADYDATVLTIRLFGEFTGNVSFSGFGNIYVDTDGTEKSNANRITSAPVKCYKGDRIFFRNPIYQYVLYYYKPDGTYNGTTIATVTFRNPVATIEYDGFVRLGIYSSAALSPSSYSNDWICASLTHYIDEVYIEPIWEQGGFTGAGIPSDSTTRIRSQYMLATEGDTVTPTYGVKCNVIMYSDANYKYYIGECGWIATGNTYTIPQDCYIRILIGANDNSAINPHSINTYHFKCRITAKTKRYVNEKDADLKDAVASNAIANADVISKVEQVLTHGSAFAIDDMGMVYAAYYCNDSHVYEDYHDVTNYIDFFKFDLLNPQNRTQIGTIKVGDTLGDYTIAGRPPYDLNVYRFGNTVRLYFISLNGTEYQLGYIDYDITTQTLDTDYHVCTLNGETFNVTQLLSVAESSITVTDSLYMIATGKIVYRDGYYYTAVALGGNIGSLSDFNGIAIRSADGINWSFYVKPPSYGLGGICYEASLEFSGDYMFWIERRNASGAGIYLYRYEIGANTWRTDYLNMNGADSKPRLELYYDKLYAFYNAKDAEKDTEGLFISRADFIISEIDVVGFAAKEILKIKSKGGCQYPYVYNNKGFLYLMFSGNRRALRDPDHETTTTGCRSNICLSDITYLI